MTAADMVRVQQLVELMFVGGLRFDADGGTVINGTRWDYETSIFVSIELLATVGMYRPICHRLPGLCVQDSLCLCPDLLAENCAFCIPPHCDTPL